MAKINNDPPKQPLWPWGGPRGVRERLVDTTQLERKKKAKKAGDPKNPALPSVELLEFIGYANGADEMRLPAPPMPSGHDADLSGLLDGPQFASVMHKFRSEAGRALEKNLGALQASPDRLARMQALLAREGQMLELVGNLHDIQQQIRERMREEQKESGF